MGLALFRSGISISFGFAWLAVIAVGCSGGDADPTAGTTVTPTSDASSTAEPSPTSTATPTAEERFERALAELEAEDLPGLTLGWMKVNGAGGFVDRSSRSGFVANADVAASFPALGFTEADIDSLGRVAGYQVAIEPFADSGAPATIEVGVDLFTSPERAAAYVEAREQELSLTDPTMTVTRAESFDVGRVGRGMSTVAMLSGLEEEVSATTAWVQRGQVVSWASMVEFGYFDRTVSVGLMAEVQAEHIEAVLGGNRSPTDHSEVPRVGESRHPTERPRTTSDPDLAELAVAAEALPRPFRLVWTGYIADPTIDHAYIRDFDDQALVKFTTLPQSRMRVQTTWLPPGEVDYGIFIAGLRDTPSETLTKNMRAASSIPDLEIITVEDPGYGETATLIIGEGSGLRYATFWIDDGAFAVRVVLVGRGWLVTPEEIELVLEAVAAQFDPPAG